MARPSHNADLHGNAPESAETALLLIDVINDFRFAGGAALAKNTQAILPNLVRLRTEATRRGVPVIYVNDNSGKWRSDFKAVLHKAAAAGSRGRALVKKLTPRRGDYVVLKPKQSGFYATPLEVLLDYLKVRRLVIAGLTADVCVFFTAQDAFVRDYELWIPEDAVASQDSALKHAALQDMERLFQAQVTGSSSIKWRSR